MVSLELADGLVGVHCQHDGDGALVLDFDTRARADAFVAALPSAAGGAPHVVLLGGTHFGCRAEPRADGLSGGPATVAHRAPVDTAEVFGGASVVFPRTEPARMEHVFAHARVSVSRPALDPDTPRRLTAGCPATCAKCIAGGGGTGCLSPNKGCSDCGQKCTKCIAGGGGKACGTDASRGCAVTTCPAKCGQCVRSGGGGSCLGSCSGCGSDCSTCLQGGGGASCTDRCKSNPSPTECNVGLVVVGRCTVSTNGNKQFPGKTFDYSGKTLYSGRGVDIVCARCFATLSPTIYFNVEIQNNQLKSVGLSAKGSVGVTVQSTLSAAAKYATSSSKVLTTLPGPSVTFFIGAFPVHLETSVPISGGVSFNFAGSAEASAAVGFSGSVTGGVLYSGGSFSPLFDRQARPSFTKPTVNATASAAAVAYLEPSVVMTVDKVVHGTVSLRPYTELDFAGGSGGVDAALYFGYNAWVSGQLGVKLGGQGIGPQKTIATKQLLADKIKVWSGHLGGEQLEAPALPPMAEQQ